MKLRLTQDDAYTWHPVPDHLTGIWSGAEYEIPDDIAQAFLDAYAAWTDAERALHQAVTQTKEQP
jgi:hypothetical protein